MSTMPGNPHAKDADLISETIGEHWIAQEGMTDATGIASVIQANTEATLALAFEQRTANLMARRSELKVIGLDYMAANLAEMIDSRLGLDGDDSWPRSTTSTRSPDRSAAPCGADPVTSTGRASS